MKNIITCTKRFGPYPFAHRQHRHDGHCALIHGHNWDFEVTFQASYLDENGFVVDFGKLGEIKRVLAEVFDHTLCVNSEDPALERLKELGSVHGLAKVVVIKDGSAEGIAVLVRDLVEPALKSLTLGRVAVKAVTVREDEKNFATFTAIP